MALAHHRSQGRGGRGFHLGLEIAVWMGRMEGTMIMLVHYLLGKFGRF